MSQMAWPESGPATVVPRRRRKIAPEIAVGIGYITHLVRLGQDRQSVQDCVERRGAAGAFRSFRHQACFVSSQ
jgi:hypothetical protein